MILPCFTEMIQLGSILAIAWLYRAKIADDSTLVGAAFLLGHPHCVRASGGGRSVVLGLRRRRPAQEPDGDRLGLHRRRAGDATRRAPGDQADATSVDEPTFAQALGVGVCQVLALVPGVYEVGSTICSAVLGNSGRGAQPSHLRLGETHDGEELWVVRKGATPAFPGQKGFVANDGREVGDSGGRPK